MEVLSWSWRPHLMWAESAQQEAEERNWWLWLLYNGTKNNRMTKDRKAEEKGKTKNWEWLKGSLKAILKPLIGDISGCLVVRLPLPMQGMQFQSLVRELRFHMAQGQKTKTGAILWQIHLKMTHIKKKNFIKRPHWMYTFKGWILWYINYISIRLLLEHYVENQDCGHKHISNAGKVWSFYSNCYLL